MNSSKGFTLIETLVVLGLLTLIFGLSFQGFSQIDQEDRLNTWAQEIVSTLNQAKLKAQNGASLSGSQPLPFGVHFTTDQFILFPGATYQPADTRNFPQTLPGSLSFSLIDLPSGQKILFQRISGEVSNFDPLHHRLILKEKKSVRQRIIQFNRLGVVEVSSQP